MPSSPSGRSTVDSTDLFLRSSADGVLWSNPVKINDDGLADRVQFHPAMRVDPATGDVFVAWYDARNSSTNRAVEIYAARSLDCGTSFEPNVRVTSFSTDFRNFTTRASNENSTDNPLYNDNQYGEYMGLDAAGGRAYISWVDTREFWPSWTDRPEKENLGFSQDRAHPVPALDGGVERQRPERPPGLLRRCLARGDLPADAGRQVVSQGTTTDQASRWPRSKSSAKTTTASLAPSDGIEVPMRR
jgi:hypothetical protein